MLPIYLVVAAVLAVAPAAHAQDATERQEGQQPEAQAPPPERYAVPRPSAPEPETGTRIEAATAPPSVVVDQDQRRAVPRGARPRGDNPPVGTAVPRGTRPAPEPQVDRGGRVYERDRDRRDRGRTVIVSRPPVYNNYYHYPRRYYRYGYGAFGLGYFYYDPYRWYPRSYSIHGPSYYGHGYGHGYYGSSFFDVGELRLHVTPRHAQVFVDGYYAGIVDDFDGMFQGLKLESGPYHIELVSPGYEPLEFDIRINRGQKINYRGDLLVRRP